MTNQEAINYLLDPLSLPHDMDIKDKLRWHEDALNMAIEALKAQEVPSVQPEKRTEERTETHACDLIDRRDAIDAVQHAFDKETVLNSFVRKVAIDALKVMPSAQPEIIRCKDCKWFGNIGCAINIVDDSDRPTEMDFCSFAERRGEQDDGHN